MFLKPEKGLEVLDPRTMRPLKAEGQEVTGFDSYWVRQIQAGDVTLATPKATPKPKPAKAEKTEKGAA